MHIQSIKTIKPNKFSAHGGKGKISMRFSFENLKGTGMWSFFGIAELPVGATAGYHKHEGNDEWFLILEGAATITIDGESKKIKKGDCILTRDGSSHGITKVTKKLKFIAVEVNKFDFPKPWKK